MGLIMEVQRRCHLRAKVINTIDMNDVEGDISFDVKDISEGGAFIYSDLLMDEGEIVSLAFALPNGYPIKTQAVILRSEKNENNDRGAGMAVRFTTISRADSKAISDYILKAFKGPIK